MRKFIIHSGRDKTAIMEVECQLITPVEDPSVMWLPKGEYRARLLKPATLVEKDGKPLVWHSIAFYDTLEIAREAHAAMTRAAFEFEFKKYKTAYTEEQVQATLASTEVVML